MLTRERFYVLCASAIRRGGPALLCGGVCCVLSAVCCVLVSGCRTATQLTEVPRVDLELASGNRGYLVGTAPTEATLKTTRQMLEITIELPSFHKPNRSNQQVGLDNVAAPERKTNEPATGGSWGNLGTPGASTGGHKK